MASAVASPISLAGVGEAQEHMSPKPQNDINGIAEPASATSSIDNDTVKVDEKRPDILHNDKLGGNSALHYDDCILAKEASHKHSSHGTGTRTLTPPVLEAIDICNGKPQATEQIPTKSEIATNSFPAALLTDQDETIDQGTSASSETEASAGKRDSSSTTSMVATAGISKKHRPHQKRASLTPAMAKKRAICLKYWSNTRAILTAEDSYLYQEGTDIMVRGTLNSATLANSDLQKEILHRAQNQGLFSQALSERIQQLSEFQLRRAIMDFQNDGRAGLNDTKWRLAAMQSSRKRANRQFDPYLDFTLEQRWGVTIPGNSVSKISDGQGVRDEVEL